VPDDDDGACSRGVAAADGWKATVARAVAEDVVSMPGLPSTSAVKRLRPCSTSSWHATRIGIVAGKLTPAVAAAENAGISYRLHEYEHDARAQSYGFEAAVKLGVEPARVFKTLVATVGGTPRVAIVPVEAELDLRALGKRAAMCKPADAERITGYVTGGISPLGQRQELPTLVDESALGFDTVFVSAGRRGLELELAPADLVRLTGGRAAPITRR
jgi:Cys-tRNA(Pro)/Cys-tRNA(Cys) deacylase